MKKFNDFLKEATGGLLNKSQNIKLLINKYNKEINDELIEEFEKEVDDLTIEELCKVIDFILEDNSYFMLIDLMDLFEYEVFIKKYKLVTGEKYKKEELFKIDVDKIDEYYNLINRIKNTSNKECLMVYNSIFYLRDVDNNNENDIEEKLKTIRKKIVSQEFINKCNNNQILNNCNEDVDNNNENDAEEIFKQIKEEIEYQELIIKGNNNQNLNNCNKYVNITLDDVNKCFDEFIKELIIKFWEDLYLLEQLQDLFKYKKMTKEDFIKEFKKAKFYAVVIKFEKRFINFIENNGVKYDWNNYFFKGSYLSIKCLFWE